MDNSLYSNIFGLYDDMSTFNIVGDKTKNGAWKIPCEVDYKVALADVESENIKISAIINRIYNDIRNMKKYVTTCSVLNDHICFKQSGDGEVIITEFYYAYFDVYDDKLYHFRDMVDRLRFSRVKKITNIRKKI